MTSEEPGLWLRDVAMRHPLERLAVGEREDANQRRRWFRDVFTKIDRGNESLLEQEQTP